MLRTRESNTRSFVTGILLLTTALSFALPVVVTAQTELPNPAYNPALSDQYGRQGALGRDPNGRAMAFVSDPRSNGLLTGAIHQFSRINGDLWNHTMTFWGPSTAYDFGATLDLVSEVPAWGNGWALAIGDSLDSAGGNAAGAAYVWWETGGTSPATNLTRLPHSASSGDRFGNQVVFAGAALLVSAFNEGGGTIRRFEATNSGGILTWTKQGGVLTAVGSSFLGTALAASGEWLFASGYDSNGRAEIWVFRDTGGGFAPYSAQPVLFGGLPLQSTFHDIDLAGSSLTAQAADTDAVVRSHEFRFDASAGLWRPFLVTSRADWVRLDHELRVGLGDPYWVGSCAFEPLQAWRVDNSGWEATAVDPAPEGVHVGSIDLFERRILLGSVGGRFCDKFGLNHGTAYVIDFFGDRDFDGVADATQIANDPCLDLDGNGILDDTEGGVTYWRNPLGGDFMTEWSSVNQTWNWSSGLPIERPVVMEHSGATPAVVRLTGLGPIFGIYRLRIAGNPSAAAELSFELTPGTFLDVVGLGCPGEVRIEDLGRIDVDSALLTCELLDVRQGGNLSLLGSNALTQSDRMPIHKGTTTIGTTGLLKVAQDSVTNTGLFVLDGGTFEAPEIWNSDRIEGHGTVVGTIHNGGPNDMLPVVLADELNEDLNVSLHVEHYATAVAQDGGHLVQSDDLWNEGLVQATGSSKITIGGDFFNLGNQSGNNDGTYIENSNVNVTATTKNSWILCLVSNSVWTTGGTGFSNSGSLGVSGSTIFAPSFSNTGNAEFSGTANINTPASTGTITNANQMCVTGGFLNMTGLAWTNLGTVCIATGAFTFFNGGVLMPGGGVFWNCTCGFTTPCGSAPWIGSATPATLFVGDDLVADEAATLSLETGLLQLVGNFDVAIDDPKRRTLNRGTIQLLGISQELEMLGPDLGPNPTRTAQTRGQIGTLHLGPAQTTVKLVDHNDNGHSGPDVLYVGDLILDSQTTLDLAGQTVYYETLQQAPDDTVTDSVGGGQLVQSGSPFGGAGLGRGKLGRK